MIETIRRNHVSPPNDGKGSWSSSRWTGKEFRPDYLTTRVFKYKRFSEATGEPVYIEECYWACDCSDGHCEQGLMSYEKITITLDNLKDIVQELSK